MQIAVLFRRLLSQRDFATDRREIDINNLPHTEWVSYCSRSVDFLIEHEENWKSRYNFASRVAASMSLTLNCSLNLNAERICRNDSLKHATEQVGHDCQTQHWDWDLCVMAVGENKP